MTDVREVTTPVGVARLHMHRPRRSSGMTLVLGHGAGGGVEAPDLQALADELPRMGHRVVLVEQPWRVAGRALAPNPGTLDVAWLAAVRALRSRALVVGGRSAGARVACRTAGALGAVGVVALAFPLHPPGRPERSRGAELRAAAAPALVVQGARDAFGSPREVRRAAPSAVVRTVSGADHSLRQRPDVVALHVREFLGSLGGRE